MSDNEGMNIDLAPDLEKQLADVISQGVDPNAIIRSGLENVADAEEWLANELQKGLDDLEAGRYTTLRSSEDIEAFMDSINAEIDQETK